MLLWKITLISNISKMVTDTTMGPVEVEYKTTQGWPRPLTLDDFELFYFNVIKITRQIFCLKW